MFRCFWNWVSEGNVKAQKVGGKRREKQRQRKLLAEQRRAERERLVSKEQAEINKQLLKETFIRLNSFETL
jgi:hypothetical protein